MSRHLVSADTGGPGRCFCDRQAAPAHEPARNEAQFAPSSPAVSLIADIVAQPYRRKLRRIQESAAEGITASNAADGVSGCVAGWWPSDEYNPAVSRMINASRVMHREPAPC